MRSILNESDRVAICSRVRSLSASSTARWGRMSVTEMLQHLRLSAQMAVGELKLASANKRAFQVFPLKHLILYVLPFPKGAPTAPELRPDGAAALEEERAALLAPCWKGSELAPERGQDPRIRSLDRSPGVNGVRPPISMSTTI